MADKDVLQIKKLTDLADVLSQKDRLRELFKKIESGISRYQEAFAPRRKKLLELNSIYRGKSYFNQMKVEWQTKSFYNLCYDAVERKTSVLHQALYGNRLQAPFSTFGRTPEDQDYAFAVEGVLNNTLDRTGFYTTSEECLRSVVKYGLGIYFYGWERREEDILWREPLTDVKGKIQRDEDGNAVLRFTRKKYKVSQPFIRSIDIVDSFGFDPTTRKFGKWTCDYIYLVDPMSPEQIAQAEEKGIFWKGSVEKLDQDDPHGLTDDIFKTPDQKVPKIRRDEGVKDITPEKNSGSLNVVRWFGWFDVDGDGKREFIEAVVIPNKKLCLRCQELLVQEYPVVDVHFSRSLHGMTSWGVLDPVVDLQYEINERRCQRGDSIKLKINPQFMINMDFAYENHAYVSVPGAMHPFRTGDQPVGNAMVPVQFQNNEHLSWQDEDRDISTFARLTGVADLNSVLSSSNKDTPASTVLAIFNEQQAGNSMIVNGVLERHGELGARILKLIQLYGDDKFIFRTAGSSGIQFHEVPMENILGEYDVKVTTSTFFGNRNIELQHLLQLKPLLVNAPHVDQVEYDRAILENILPKRVDRIIKLKRSPLTAMQEQAIAIAGQCESLKISDSETLITLKSKLRQHEQFLGSELFKKLHPYTQKMFVEYVQQLIDQAQILQTQQDLANQQAQAGQPEMQGGMEMGGNMENTGMPEVRQQGNMMRPTPNNIPQL